jgi:glutamyl-tRNA reductase
MLLSLAVDHRHANVATRERFHLTAARLAALYGAPDPAGPPRGARRRRPLGAEAAGRPPADCVAVATCNRSEVYAWAPAAAGGARALEAAYGGLARAWMGDDASARDLLAAARRRTGDGAVRHLLRVAAGVESQVLGDAQLLGQLRDAHLHAAAARAAGSVLHRLFERALHVGKRVRSETALASGRHSVGAEAANVAARRFGSLAHARVAVVGCGKTGERAARQLAKLGATDIVLLNRTSGRAERLAEALGGRAAPFAALHAELALADVAVVATAATAPVVLAGPLGAARARCATTDLPLLLLDLAVPRNVDPALGRVPGLTLVDIDALRPAVAAGERERSAAVPQAERIVEEEVAEFSDWMREAAARDAIRPLCRALEAVCRREVAYALRATPQPAGWPPATDRAEVERAAERAAQRVAAKLLAGPMAELRGAAARGESVDALAVALARLFPADDAAQAAPVVAPPPDALPGLRADLRPPHAARGAA